MTQLLDDLRAVRDLLSVPERWTKGELARTKSGVDCHPRKVFADCWCLEGAFIRVANGDNDRYCRAWFFINNEVPFNLERGNDLIEWNDHEGTTHYDVLALLDKAIAAAEGRS